MILLQLLQIAQSLTYAAHATLHPISAVGRLMRTSLAKLVEVSR